MTAIRFSATATAALVAVLGFTALAASSARADPRNGQRHWFYGNYDRYDDRAYYDDEYYDADRDEYVIYAPPPRRIRPNRWQRRQDRLRRWSARQARKALRRETRRRETRKRQARQSRPGRQRLYDAWQNDQYGTYQPPHRDKAKKITSVPLPRSKPYNLMSPKAPAPVATRKTPVNKFVLDGARAVEKFDERPVWKATPDKNPVSKQNIEVAALPKVVAPTTSTKPKATTTFKPIRIEVVKNPKTAELRKLTRKPANNQRTSNQLSCDKAKTIVSGFGFSGVTALTCTGTIYNFTAKRDGKPYSVKVSSLSGELKGVKKIK